MKVAIAVRACERKVFEDGQPSVLLRDNVFKLMFERRVSFQQETRLFKERPSF